MTYQSLTYKQTVELIRRINNGKVGFDYARYNLAQLRSIVADWINHGYFAEDYVEAAAQALLSETPKLPQPSVAMPLPAHVAVAAPTIPLPQSAHAVPQPTPQGAAILAAVAACGPTPAPTTVAPSSLLALADVAPSLPAAPHVIVPTACIVGPHKVSAATVFPEFSEPAQVAALAAITLTHYASPDAPAVDPSYIMQYGHVLQACAALSCTPTLRVWLAGPRGTGKTEFVRQIAARLGRPLFRVNFNRATEASEVIGDQGLRGGNTEWVDGPVAAACRTMGALLLLDEFTYASAGNSASLNPLLEMSGAHVRLPRTGDTLHPAEGFACFAADNTTGFGDATGEYVSRNVMGSDTRDRFSLLLTFSYLPADDERKLLRNVVQRQTGLRMKSGTAKAIIAVVSVARQKAQSGELMGAPSLRGCSAFAIMLARGVPVVDAYTSTIIGNAPPESAEELRQIFAAHWPADLLPSDTNNPQFFA